MINLVNHCNYPVRVDVGSQNGTAYQNTYEFASPNAIGALNLPTYQTLTLAGSWPLGLAFATRVNGTVVGSHSVATIFLHSCGLLASFS